MSCVIYAKRTELRHEITAITSYKNNIVLVQKFNKTSSGAYAKQECSQFF